MGFTPSLIVTLLLSQITAAAATAGESAPLREPPHALSGKKDSGKRAGKPASVTAAAPLDRVADAVDGAESSHGRDAGMWRPDPAGPQGPMQVTEAAASDVGGGDRFDLTQNRALGRAYLAQLYWRYKNWPDAIAAYNWGIGNMDDWVKAGRPPDKFLSGVAVYLSRVLHESGLCDGSDATRNRQSSGRVLPPTVNRQAHREPSAGSVVSTPDRLAPSACSVPSGRGAASGYHVRSSRFATKLEQAMQLVLSHAKQER